MPASRMRALWRIVAFLWAWTGAALITSIIATIGLILAAVDIVWTLIVGSDGIDTNGRWMGMIANTWTWMTDIHIFAYTGRGGGFNFLPSL